MSENKLTSYNFLATLTENGKDLYGNVYIPICKRALSKYSEKGKEFGADSDIQEQILEMYGFNVPITIVRQLIKASANSFSRKEKQETAIEIYENGKNFKMKLFVFNRYEKIYSQLSTDSKLLQKAFASYYCDCSDEGILDSEIPEFADFIDKNKNKLSHFFAGQDINGNDIDKSYLLHIQFIEHIEINNRFLYELAEKIYFGSVIAGFLESGIDVNAKFLSGEEYFIDTQIILRGLDLQNESDTQPAKELIDLIIKLQGKPKYLGITLSELSHILEVSIENYNKNTPTSTVNEACIRLGKNKSWLINFNNNIEENISKNLGLELETISKLNIEKYKKSKDIKELQGTRKNTANAEHDVLAYLHIRDKRDNLIRSYQKAKYWFVSANKTLYQFNISKNPAGVTSEVILPDTLTSLLWLKGNRTLDKTIKKIGLTELMLQTFHEEIASKELINDFHAAVSEKTSIEDGEYEVLLSSIAHQSAKRIQKLVELSEVDKERFNEKVHQTIAKERERKKKEGQQKQATINDLKKEKEEKDIAKNRLAEIEHQLQLNDSSNKSEIEKLKEDIANQKGELTQQKARLSKFKRAIFILFISLILLVLVLISIEAWSKIKIILAGITGLGGLWGFISLMINIYKMAKE
ncbi:hypothetical protein [Saccharicrinis fermentans]|uniref:hypothetical protein n=1 Tax=Saccharicrinis fermentans TaxID=982 RepID=UPI000481E04B|nr:hypothetical protein [Saccharicrinis fermentans]